jgi:hypothetical protein
MTVLEEIAQIVSSLGPAEQRQVLDVVIQLRDARKLPDITLPPAEAGDAAWPRGASECTRGAPS